MILWVYLVRTRWNAGKVKKIGSSNTARGPFAEKRYKIEGIWVELSYHPHGFKDQAGKVSGYCGST